MSHMDNVYWFFVAPLAVAFVLAMARGAVVATRWVFAQAAEATAHKVVEYMGGQLSAQWDYDIAEALAPVHTKLDAIDAELTLNGGSTVKDGVWQLRSAVDDMQAQLEALLTGQKRKGT